MTQSSATMSDTSPASQTSHNELANSIRALSMDAVQRANSGHPGMPMGMADVATVLFSEFLNFDPKHPEWPNRDRFVLSAGHGSMLLYSLLYLTGYEDMSLDDIKNFRVLGSKTAGHPEFGHASGIETTTGPLGQGIANAVGMALAERMTNARFGDSITNHHTYCIAGDGCLMEGISHEAASLAGHLKLGKLIVLWDDNGITIDGSTDLSTSEDVLGRHAAYGWNTDKIDGHDAGAISKAIAAAQDSDKPTIIACKTTIGYGSPNKGGTAGSHGAPLGDDEIALARKELGWPHASFEIPDHVLASWRGIGSRGAKTYDQWALKYDTQDAELRDKFENALTGELGESWQPALDALKKEMAASDKAEATRKSSQRVLEVLNEHIEQLIGGSADLTGSNNTKTGALTPITASDYSGRYAYYGIREHGMAAVMNGMSLYGGFIPYSGTFLVFTDYCKPSIRLSALMEQRVIYVMTHDSIGLGEDGPTHQPIEHLPSLRSIPNLLTFRPADAVETTECWALAVSQTSMPSVLALSRQGLPNISGGARAGNPCAKGAYVVQENDGAAVTLIATGSEVSLAIAAAEELAKQDITARVVSMPCTELFDNQPASYREEVLGTGLRVSIEAASTYGWAKYTRSSSGAVAQTNTGIDGLSLGIDSFGASGPAPDVYKHFGLTAESIAAKVKSTLG